MTCAHLSTSDKDGGKLIQFDSRSSVARERFPAVKSNPGSLCRRGSRLAACSRAALFIVIATKCFFAPRTALAQGTLRVVSTVGALERNASLGEIGFVRLLSGGRIMLSQPREGTVLIYSAKGKLEAKLGRRGEGPGEFRSPTSGGEIGDSLWVFDAQLHRVSYFSRVGRPTRDAKVPMLIGPAQSAGMDGSGRLLVWTAFPLPGSAPQRGLIRLGGLLVRPTPLLIIPDDPCLARQARGPAFSIPYCSRPYWEFSSDGKLSVLLDPVTSRYQATGKVRLVEVWLRGDTLRTLTLDLPRQPLENKAFDSVLAKIAPRVGITPDAASKLVTKPDFLPPANWLLSDPSGAVWLGQAHPNGRIRWTSVSTEGKVVGYLETSLETRILAANGKELLVAESSPDGEERIVWWRIAG